jgi:Flp pilus assembly pilin Flp
MRVISLLKRLHADERGAEGLEKLLIVAAIVLPLLGLLIVFRDAIKGWVTSVWGEATTAAGNQGPSYFDPSTVPAPTSGGGGG